MKGGVGLVQSNMMSAGGFVTHYGAAGFFNNNNKKRTTTNNNNAKIGSVASGANQAYGYEHPPQISSSNDNSIMIGSQTGA